MFSKCLSLLSLLAFCNVATIAQTTDSTAQEKGSRLILSPGISYQRQWFGELNLMLVNKRAEEGSSCGGPVAAGPRLGIETNFSRSDRIIAPKIGYEISGLVICLRANTVYYIGSNVNDLRFLPEMGISVSALANLTYGYGFSLLRNSLPEVSRSRITLTFNLDKIIWENR